jgi:REP element-mobilizing transposase RayT
MSPSDIKDDIMPKPRKALVSLDATPYYHCVSRCVRRAFLCGMDTHSGKSYEHRRQWLKEKILSLSQVFALDVCAYAVMSNHYHVVLHVDAAKAKNWSVGEVIRRWHSLFAGHPLTHQFLVGAPLLKVEQKLVNELAEQWRSRLTDISWYMRCLNETIARQANEEDQCSGRFWEGRFKSQALLDEKALAACMAYVDLNPVRAGMAKTPEESDYTSLQERVVVASEGELLQPPTLMPFVGNPRAEMPKGLPFRLADYLELVDWTGRALREDKRGAIAGNTPPILERLQVDPRYWLFMAQHFESRFKGLVGTAYTLKAACESLGYRRTPNLAACRELLNCAKKTRQTQQSGRY